MNCFCILHFWLDDTLVSYIGTMKTKHEKLNNDKQWQ